MGDSFVILSAMECIMFSYSYITAITISVFFFFFFFFLSPLTCVFEIVSIYGMCSFIIKLISQLVFNVDWERK